MTTETYNLLNNLTTMQYSGQSANLREDFTYTARDQQAFLTRYSNLAATTTVGTTSMGYDAVGRLTNLQHKDGSAVNIANYTHTYDAASRVTTEKLNAGATTTYQYDTTDQLTNDAVVTYTYDPNGNRTMSGYSTGPNNQLTSDGAWNYYADKNGNITQKINPSTGEIYNYSFDNRNRLTTVTDTTSSGAQMSATYTHDALGQRVQKAVWTASSGTTTTTRFAYDNRQIIADLDGSSALTMRYLLGSRILERLARISSAGTVAWLLTDRLGSIRNVVNSGGTTIDTAAFDGFGNIVSQSSPANGGAYLYAGYRIDSETGLLLPDPRVFREYDSLIGRWRSVDIVWVDANLWRYVGNNPTNKTDPLGLADSATIGLPVQASQYWNDAQALRLFAETFKAYLSVAAYNRIGARIHELESAPAVPVRPYSGAATDNWIDTFVSDLFPQAARMEAEMRIRVGARRAMDLVQARLGLAAFPAMADALCEFNYAWCLWGLEGCNLSPAPVSGRKRTLGYENGHESPILPNPSVSAKARSRGDFQESTEVWHWIDPAYTFSDGCRIAATGYMESAFFFPSVHPSMSQSWELRRFSLTQAQKSWIVGAPERLHPT